MIDISGVRDRITAELAARLPDLEATLYPRGVDGVFNSPAVVLGQPSTEFDVAPCSVHRYTLPVAVAVARPGIDDQATQRVLDDTAQRVASALSGMIDDQSWPDDVVGVKLTRSDPGALTVHGQGYPALLLSLELLG